MRSAWLLGTLLLSFATGCEDDTTGPIRTLPLDGPVLFDVLEMYGDPGARVPDYSAVGEPRLALWLETEKEYGCGNFHIDTRWTPVGRTIRVELLRLSRLDGGCALPPEFGPAADAFFLDLNPGDYTLAFTRNGDLNTFHLSVTTSSISTDPDSAAFTGAQHPLRWRKPPRSFVCLCATMTNTSWICEDFVNKLSEVVPLTEFRFPESGQAPYPTTSTGHDYDAPARYFLYGNEADYARAGDFLELYAHDVIGTNMDIGIALSNWRNERFGGIPNPGPVPVIRWIR